MDAAKSSISLFHDLRNVLEQEYILRIVNQPGEPSGVWRIPDLNETARNYYIIVEAVDFRGDTVTVSIVNEETGTRENVQKWGLRVDEHIFAAVGHDKNDDGIIQNNRFGEKKRGHLAPEYFLPTSGAAITQW